MRHAGIPYGPSAARSRTRGPPSDRGAGTSTAVPPHRGPSSGPPRYAPGPDALHRISAADRTGSPGRRSGRLEDVADNGASDETPRTRISDPKVMRALAHPARLTILEELGLGRAGTAT